MEQDIVEANIRNCFAHGASRVLLVDNASSDSTVKRARDARAEVAFVFHTDHYEEELRVTYINALVKRAVMQEKLPNHWIVVLDADEFIQVPGQRRLADYLCTVDQSCRTVGFNSIEHMPTNQVSNIEGRHPAEFQPYVWERMSPFCCVSRHYEHPIARFRDGVWDMKFSRGFHYPMTPDGRPIMEPNDTLYVHHFPFRNEAETRARLKLLCEKHADGDHRSSPDDAVINGEGAIKRYRSLDAVYRGDWANVEIPHAYDKRNERGPNVRHWSALYSEDEYLPLKGL